MRPLHCARLGVRSWGWECGEDTAEEGRLNHSVLSRCLGTSTHTQPGKSGESRKGQI